MHIAQGTLLNGVDFWLRLTPSDDELLLELNGYPHVVDPITVLDRAILELGYVPLRWVKPDGTEVPHGQLREQFWQLMHTVRDIEPPRMQVYVAASEDTAPPQPED